MASRVLKTLTTVIAVLCFVPLAVVFLFGLLFLPGWISMIGLMLFDDRFTPIAEGQVWTAVIPILIVIAGGLGVVGLYRIVRSTRHEESSSEQAAKTLILCAAGLGAVALLLTYTSVSLSMDELLSNLPFLFIYLIFPIIGAILLLFLARQALVKRSDPDEE